MMGTSIQRGIRLALAFWTIAAGGVAASEGSDALRRLRSLPFADGTAPTGESQVVYLDGDTVRLLRPAESEPRALLENETPLRLATSRQGHVFVLTRNDTHFTLHELDLQGRLVEIASDVSPGTPIAGAAAGKDPVVVFGRAAPGRVVPDNRHMEALSGEPIYALWAMDSRERRLRQIAAPETIAWPRDIEQSAEYTHEVWSGDHPMLMARDGSWLLFQRVHIATESGSCGPMVTYFVRLDSETPPAPLRNPGGRLKCVLPTDGYGDLVLYEYWSVGGPGRGLYVLDLSTGESLLLAAGHVADAAFSHDGRKMAYVVSDPWGRSHDPILRVLDIPSGTTRDVADLGRDSYRERFEWSADGAWLLARFGTLVHVESGRIHRIPRAREARWVHPSR